MLDKAIATVACYIGLCGTDILSLTPENLGWEKVTIHLDQTKTGVELTLPMNATVGNAIWEYLVYEHHPSAERYIFVKVSISYGKISKTWDHLKNLFNEAGVRTNGGRTGVRIFLHHFFYSRKASGKWNGSYDASLHSFDKYCAEQHPDALALTEEMLGWCNERLTENGNSCRDLITVVSGQKLMRYLVMSR